MQCHMRRTRLITALEAPESARKRLEPENEGAIGI